MVVMCGMIDKQRFQVKLADEIFRIECMFSDTKAFLSEYLTCEESSSSYSVSVGPEDILYEKEKSRKSAEAEGREEIHWSDAYLEKLAVYRQIAEILPKLGGVLFHGSVIAVDGKGHLFTAVSGTGKSTHTRLWREYLGDRAVMINDDKPLILLKDGEVRVYGTPWDGKHHLSMNTSVPLVSIVDLERGEKNYIEKVDPMSIYPLLLQQMYRPKDPVALASSLKILDRIMKQVHFYRLKCNMDIEAAKVAFETLGSEEKR